MIKINCLGSSHAKRLAFYLQHPNPYSNVITCAQNSGISGARISDVKALIKQSPTPIQSPLSPIVLIIGTNDILNGADIVTIKKQYISLVRLVLRRFPSAPLLLVQLPIFPRCQGNSAQIKTIGQFNKYVASLANQGIKIIPLDMLLTSPRFFKKYYPRTAKQDNLHLNSDGYSQLVSLIVGILSS